MLFRYFLISRIVDGVNGRVWVVSIEKGVYVEFHVQNDTCSLFVKIG